MTTIFLKSKLFILSSFILLISFNFRAQCRNGGAEDNDFSVWGASSGPRTQTGVSLASQVPGVNSAYHNIMNVGYDPIVGGTLLPTVGDGQHSFRIGNNVTDMHADRMYYTFYVSAASANFGFKYAMVLEDGEHEGLENPNFNWMIVQGNDPNVLSVGGVSNIIHQETFIADKNSAFYKKGGNNTIYRDWSYACHDLTAYIGTYVTVSFMVMDCGYGGHYAYAYIDALCSNHDPVPSFELESFFCPNDPIIMDATNSQNEDSYFISIQESDVYWSAIGPEYSQWFIAQQAATIDLKAFMKSMGGELQCNKRYRVKLAVTNACVQWVDEVKLIQVYCPQMNPIDDISICCDGEYGSVNVGPITNLTSGYTTSWSISQGNVFTPNPGPTDVSVTVPLYGSSTVNYTLTQLIDVGGKHYKECSVSDNVNINMIDDFEIEIVEDSLNSSTCESLLKVNVEFLDGCSSWSQFSPAQKQSFLDALDFQWSNGSTESQIYVSGSSQTYSVTVSLNSCFSHSASYNYVQSAAYTNGAPYAQILQAPNALIAGATTNSGKLIIIASTYDAQGILWPQLGTHQGIYGAKQIRLQIFNRWGTLFKTLIFSNCEQLYQGDIYWDGTDNNGNFVHEGVYTYKIAIETCSGGWEPYCNPNMYSYLTPGTCVDYCFGHIPDRPWYTFGWYCCQTYDGPDCAYKVTVLN